MKKFYSVGVGIKSWCEDPEGGALAQAENVASLPFSPRYVALMPDAHEGYGMPIGGVAAFDMTVIPNAVGVDIGCGMLACQLDVEGIVPDTLKTILSEIREEIPVGFNSRKEALDERLLPPIDDEIPIVKRLWERAQHQLGTLGGGNHFLEIQKGDDDHIWFMVHSGSRNIGHGVATHYNKVAQNLNAEWFSVVDKKKDLAFLPIKTREGKTYMAEMKWCLDFAQANRDYMADCIERIINEKAGAKVLERINIHHNYAAFENHFGKNLVVHRKGATSAREGQLGIIPGSQGTASYIVIGKGNPDSYTSSSHGAGRKMGRKQAINNLDLKEEQRKLDEQGILHSIRGQKDLDEAAGAYKDIEIVMDEQADLVEIKTRLLPLAVIKG